ncbi:porin family protein [Rhizosphaericola mali]|uniref:PorT family protein n=1 Tax=Rhizosphaericola mali TaxID=2545455 RepID=A0A5P2FZF5_9BACT|nr:porin family protein [Rhizosphaericola mali]QES87199.1 PorT family protein [Rhizosphaericola mali]
MKKAILAFLFAGGLLGASAQSQHGGVSYGFNAGMSLFNVTNNDGGKSITGFSGGVYVSLPISKQVYIQPELNYQMQGTKATDISNGGSSYDVKYKMNYLNLPVLVKYNLPETNFSIYAGPQLGYLTDSKIDASGYGSYSARDIMNKVDFAGVYGLEYYFPINKVNAFTINARYSTGFTKILKSDYTSDDSNGKHKGFTFTVGLRF